MANKSPTQAHPRSRRTRKLHLGIPSAILMADKDAVTKYLSSHPKLVALLPKVCREAERLFGKEVELSLAVYSDPEIRDRHLTLCVRAPVYDKAIARRLDELWTAIADRVGRSSGWLQVTTDLRPPRGNRAV